jgi:hypothetical protein
MRKYKHLTIPGKCLRYDENDIDLIRFEYCQNSDCADLICNVCLFDGKNIKEFTEWYMNKNKGLKGKQSRKA